MNRLLSQGRWNAYIRLMRLDKPIGILLLLWPTIWALLIAGDGHPNVFIVLVFVLGTVLMRSAGCVVNDIADRNFDGHVERTKARPLATNEVSVKEAYGLAGFLTILAFGLVCLLNLKTICLSIVALFLAVSYPYTKRYIHLPQAYLGIAFGFGMPMAFAAISNTVPLVAWLLLIVNIFWALAYDTEYAMVDRDDDLKIGIKSSAIFFGQFDVLAIMVCFAAMMILLSYIGVLLGYAQYYFIGLFCSSCLVIRQYGLIKKGFKAQCFKAFKDNTWIGFAISVGLLLELTLH
jgi:4-hydroxybenzoate polyprenyltransferase